MSTADAGSLAQHTIRPHPDVIAQRIGERMVLIHLQTNHIYELNRTGARLWELVETVNDRRDIQQQMLHEFDVEETQLSQEIAEFLALLMNDDLVVIG